MTGIGKTAFVRAGGGCFGVVQAGMLKALVVPPAHGAPAALTSIAGSKKNHT